MSKFKFTKGELKKQRDALKQYERYLPTLQLKKQQLQMEILKQLALVGEKKAEWLRKRKSAELWAGVLSTKEVDFNKWLSSGKIVTDTRNIAGVDFPIFNHVEFLPFEYDFFATSLWVDSAFEILKMLMSAKEEIKTIEESITILKQELKITTQRVNLFEKVKIPEAQVAIRVIKIYLGDQMSNAVGRSKIAKRKIEEMALETEGVLA